MLNNIRNHIKHYLTVICIIIFSLVFSPITVQSQVLHSGISNYIDTLLHIWFGGNNAQYDTTLNQLQKLLVTLSKNQKDPQAKQSYLTGQMFVALLEYNLETFDSLRSSITIDSLYVHRADTLYALMNYPASCTITNYINQSEALRDYDYLIIGNYFLQRGEYAKARQWYLNGIQKSITLRQSFDILLGVADAIEKGDDTLCIKTKSGKAPHYLCLLPYLRPQDIFYYLKNDIPLKASYTLTIIPSHKFSYSAANEYLQQGQFPLTRNTNTSHCTMADIINCFTTILALSGKEPELSHTLNLDYLPEYMQTTASYLIVNNIVPVYLDGRIPVYSTITGVHFQKMYSTYIKKFGKPVISTSIHFTDTLYYYAHSVSNSTMYTHDTNPVANQILYE